MHQLLLLYGSVLGVSWRMTSSADPDQTAPGSNLIRVCTVWSVESFPNFGIMSLLLWLVCYIGKRWKGSL